MTHESEVRFSGGHVARNRDGPERGALKQRGERGWGAVEAPTNLLTVGQICPIRVDVKGNEFLKRLRRLSKQDGTAVRYDGKPGKGSHGRVYYGAAFTTIKDLKKEIGAGLLSKMLDDLGLTKDDLK